MSNCFKLGINVLLLLQFTVFYCARSWSAVNDQDNLGCTPGYWKQYQHTASWPETLTPGQKFQEVFGTEAFPAKTLLQVLDGRGGHLQALGRHTVAALLNVMTALPEADAEFMASQVIALFASVFPGNEKDREILKNYFERFNEQDCPQSTFVWRFDFGTENSPVEYGYLRVTQNDRYGDGEEYGWHQGGQIQSVDRSSGDALLRDANLTQQADFKLHISNGVYRVGLYYRDTAPHDPFYVDVEGKSLAYDYVRTDTAGQIVSGDIAVSDGVLDVSLQALASPDDYAGPDAVVNALTVERRLLPPDPTHWESAVSGAYFRRATHTETAENDWPAGTYLVVDNDLQLDSPDHAVQFFAPLGEADHVNAWVSMDGREASGIPIVELGFGMESTDRRGELLRYTYHSPDFGEVRLISDSGTGGFWGHIRPTVYASHSARTFEVRSSEISWSVDKEISLPDGTSPGSGILYAVLPGGAPGFGLSANPSENDFAFGLVGEIRWCTANRSSWAAALAGRALYIREGFQACPEADCTRSTGVNMVQKGLYCNITISQDVAEECFAGACPKNQFGHEYTFGGCGELAECYRDRVVDNLLQARSEGFDVNELDIVQVIYQGEPKKLDGENQHSICGQASFPSGVIPADGSVSGIGGTSIVGSADVCSILSSPHEIGHNFGAIHEHSNPQYTGVGCTSTTMNPNGAEGATCNIFSNANGWTTQTCSRSDDTYLDYGGVLPYWTTVVVQAKDCPIKGGIPLISAP